MEESFLEETAQKEKVPQFQLQQSAYKENYLLEDILRDRRKL